MIATPCSDRINTNFAQCREDSANYLRKNGYDVLVTSQIGSVIFNNRNAAIQEAKIKNAEWLVFIDSDMEFGPDDIFRLIHHNAYVVAGVCKRGDGQVVLYHYKDSDNSIYPIMQLPNKPFHVDVTGFGFVGIQRDLINIICMESFREREWKGLNVQDRRLNYPFNHVTLANGVQVGEDTSFCLRMKELDVKILVDPDIKIGHEKLHVVR
jgi:glycosyltransferase involved in cell wall biosynthesis